MSKHYQTQFLASFLFILTLVLNTSMTPTQAQMFNSPLEILPIKERVSLREGQVVVTGKNGDYVAKILVTATPALVWSVLTDYTNFHKFLPHVVSSQILGIHGDRQVVEQIDSRQVFFINHQSRLRTENILKENQRIDFHLVDGDLKQLQGYWLLELVSTYPGAIPTQVLITQKIDAQPKNGTPQGIFNGILKNSLQENLTAISKEIARRTP